ncbi:MAG TPA: adenylate kinase [Blastocatellia bacterium]|nr:adenylate kinase [Blastocatellia bacterium]
MNRISVIGTSGSGKTTFAGKLAEILRIPHVELDSLSWEANWTTVPKEVFRSRVRKAIIADRWVVDGNYGKDARDLIWERADTVVWLNYSLPVIIHRLVRRTLRRIISGEECCNGNRESLRLALSRDSIIIWALQTYERRRAEYPSQLEFLEQRGVQTFKFHSPKEADDWLSRLSSAGNESYG